VFPGFIVLSLVALGVVPIAPAGAAQGAFPCQVDAAPNDGFASAALGLTRQELDALYDPGIATQTGYYYPFNGFDLTLADCDLIVGIDPDGQFADADAARELARTLLPDDAVLAGIWSFGTIQSVPQDAEEWISAELAARYRLLGEPFSGSVLVLYTYAGDAYTPGPVDHIELRPAEIPVEE
jgi:hypothetical protein